MVLQLLASEVLFTQKECKRIIEVPVLLKWQGTTEEEEEEEERRLGSTSPESHP